MHFRAPLPALARAVADMRVQVYVRHKDLDTVRHDDVRVEGAHGRDRRRDGRGRGERGHMGGLPARGYRPGERGAEESRAPEEGADTRRGERERG
jgi:hypothetical protein